MSLAELKRLHEAATPGPWVPEVSEYGDEYWFGGEGRWTSDVGPAVVQSDSNQQTVATGELIAAMRNALPALLACIEAADAWHDCDCSTCTYESSGCKLGLDIAYYQARAELEES